MSFRLLKPVFIRLLGFLTLLSRASSFWGSRTRSSVVVRWAAAIDPEELVGVAAQDRIGHDVGRVEVAYGHAEAVVVLVAAEPDLEEVARRVRQRPPGPGDELRHRWRPVAEGRDGGATRPAAGRPGHAQHGLGDPVSLPLPDVAGPADPDPRDARPQQALHRAIARASRTPPPCTATVRPLRRDRLGGLLHEDVQVA